MAGVTKRLLNEGMEKGLQKGRLEGEASVLIRQLTRRFGPLDAALLQRLRQASSAELEQWADSILDAQTLNEAFAKG